MSKASRVLIAALVISAYAVLLLPLVVVVASSFDGSIKSHLKFPPSELSLRWYVDMPTKYLAALGRSLVISSVAAVLSTLIGATAALGLARGSWHRSVAIPTFFQMPLQIPFVVTGVVFLQFYYILFDAAGITLIGTYSGLILAHLFFCVPYAVASVGSVITRDLEKIENAARIAGATEARVFRRVTLPALMPGVFSGFFYAFILSFGDVPVSVFLARPAMQPLPVEIFQTLQFDFDPAVLSISTLVVALSVVLILILRRLAGVDLILAGARK